MGKKTNKLLVSGVIGAFGVVGLAQVPSVQAAMNHLERSNRTVSQKVLDADPVHQAVHQNLQALTGQKRAAAKTEHQSKLADTATPVKSAKVSNASTKAVTTKKAQVAAQAASVAVQSDIAQTKINAAATDESAANNADTTNVAAATDESAANNADTTSAAPVTDESAANNADTTNAAAATNESAANNADTTNAAVATDESAANNADTTSAAPVTDESAANNADTTNAAATTDESAANDVTPQANQQNGLAQAALDVEQAGTAQTSGQLVAQAYQKATGQVLPEKTTDQEAYVQVTDLNGAPVSDIANPGDAVFWGNHGASYQSGIYVGNGQVATVADANTNAADQPSFVGQFN